MIRRLALGLALAAAALPAAALERLAVVAVASPPGPDADLAELTHQLRAACRDRVGNVDDAPAMRARLLGDAGTASLAELDRAYGGALATYQNGEFESAVRTLKAIVEDLEKVPEGPEAHAQWVRAQLRLAFSAASIGLEADADRAFETLARTEPTLEPDPDQFSPAFRRRFEAVKKRVRALPRRKLRLDARGGPGMVYVNGRRMGAAGPAPLELELPAGTYRVGAAAGALRVPGFTVDLAQDATALLDFALAEAVRPNAGPGLALAPDDRAGALIRAGAWLDVDKLVAVSRLQDSGAQFLVGAIHDVRRGSLLREGQVRMVAGGVPSASLGALAAFLLTGQPARGVEDRTTVAREPTRAAVPVATATATAAARPPEPAPPRTALATPAPAPADPAQQAVTPPRSGTAPGWRRPAAIGAGVGALAFAGLAVQQALAASGAREDASAMVGSDGALVAGSDPAKYQDLTEQGDAAARNAWIAGGVSAALAVTAGWLGWRSADAGPDVLAFRF